MDEWAAYWPEHADDPFGDVMNSTKKYVVSNSLRAADWQNTELIRGDAAARKIGEIKAGAGGDIAMSGSPTTCAGCSGKACSTSSTCSSTRWWSAAAWRGCSRPTIPALGSNCRARRRSSPAS